MECRNALGPAAALVAVLWLCAGCSGPPRVDVDVVYQRNVERGDVALDVGQLDDAVDAYTAALNLQPDGQDALRGMARAQLAQGHAEEALASLIHLQHVEPGAPRAGPELQKAQLEVAKLRLARGDSAGALRLLRPLRAVEPGTPGLRQLLLEALVTESGRLQVSGQSQQAADLLREAVGADPEDEAFEQALVETLVERGQIDSAISVLSDALLRRPGDPRLTVLMDHALRIRYPNDFD